MANEVETAVIDSLTATAITVLSSALRSGTLEAFNTGSKGNFPYYWQSPKDLKFNSNTYEWISSNVKANTTPTQLDEIFTNQYLNVLSKISYSLSTSDQSTLNKAAAAATDQQTALLNAWKSAYDDFPEGKGQPVDRILTEITTTWADPSVDLTTMQSSTNLLKLLNKTPPSGKPIVPVLASWLHALGSSISLQNAVTMSNSYIASALDAVQTPTKANGGMQLNNDSNMYHPAYSMAPESSLAAIMNSLKNESNKIDIKLDVERSSSSDVNVSVNGQAHLSCPIFDFFSLGISGNANYFQENICTTENNVSISMSFPGVTLVNFGPKDFDQSTLQNWFWASPIRDAINNKGADISGYKFSPEPQVDFSKAGPFGYLEGVAICNYPTVTITITSAKYESIQKEFQQSASVGISFFGIPLGIGGKESSYSNSVVTDASTQSLTITLSPPKELIAGNAIDSVGWVLGAQTCYPVA